MVYLYDVIKNNVRGTNKIIISFRGGLTIYENCTTKPFEALLDNGV